MEMPFCEDEEQPQLSKEEVLAEIGLPSDATQRDIAEKIKELREKLMERMQRQCLSRSLATEFHLGAFYREVRNGAEVSRFMDWNALSRALGL